MVSEFSGLIPLPDSFSYRPDALTGATVAMDLWPVNTMGYMFASGFKATFIEDARIPGTSWLHLGIQIACYAGSIVGCRVLAQVPVDAIVGT